MKRFAHTVLLKNDPAIIRRYEEYHANAWPDVLQGSYNCGVRRTFIYRYGRQLFMFMETVDDFDLQRDMPKYKENNPKAEEWDSLMTSLLDTVPGAPQGSTWVQMKEVFAWEGDN